MAELAVETPNLLKFPMGKLCYDLVLEVIEALEPKDVPELMKADRRFRGILLQKPGRIFGKQIHLIRIEIDVRVSLDYGREYYRDLVFIMKFAESKPLPFDFLSHELLFLSQVERCSILKISDAGWGGIDGKKLSALKKALANLKQVDTLEVKIYGDNFNDFLWNLKAEVTNRASFNFTYLDLQLMLSLINGSLQNCRMISLDLYDDADVCPRVYEALSKTQLELFVTQVYFGNLKSTIEGILNSGIPSENKEAAYFVQGEITVEIRNWIKNFPGIRQFNEPNKTFIRDTTMETLRKHGFKVECCDGSRSVSDSDHSRSDFDHSGSDFDDSLHSVDPSLVQARIQLHVDLDGPFDCYLKRIDEKRDCIYFVNDNFFFAKYVSSIQF